MEHTLIWFAIYMAVGLVIAGNDEHLPDLEGVTDSRGFDRVLCIIVAVVFILVICFMSPIFLIWNTLFRKTK